MALTASGTDEQLALIHDLAAELRVADRAAAQARGRFERAVSATSGISQLRIAEAAGLSRQRIAQLLAKGRAG